MEYDSSRLIGGSEIKTFIGVGACPDVASYRATDFVEKLVATNTVEEVDQLCSMIRLHYGFDFFAIFIQIHRLNSRPLSFYMREFEDEWTNHYERNKYILSDPSIRLAANTITPFLWSSNFFEDKVTGLLRPNEFSICYDALDFGLRDIFNAPFKNQNGDFGLVRFSNKLNGQSNEKERKENIHKIPVLYHLSSHIYEALFRILYPKQLSNLLSEREKDVLSWAAQGLNPVRISDRLNISENTVCKHLSNVRKKLGVTNTTHAVAKAIAAKTITY